MALRKQVVKDASDISSGNQQIYDKTQEDEVLGCRDDSEELSSSLLSSLSSRGKRRREKENKSKNKEMTEEEMMDLALRLSEQEATVSALRQQKEEEAMMKAMSLSIQESMVNQTQPCPPSQSQSLLADAEPSLKDCSRRKLLYSNGELTSAMDEGASEDSCTPETDLHRGARRSGDESKRSKKRKRKEGSPLLEMPDLSQTQKIYSQASPCSSGILDLPPDSPQSSDSTQIDDCQLRKSPVFPSTGRKAEVQIPQLSQDLLQACRTSGFVWCSQDSGTSPQKSLPVQHKSPTFPKSPKCSSDLTLTKSPTSPKSPVFSETDQGDDGETETSPEYCKSPIFGQNTQHEKSSSACKPQDSVCNSGFMFSSQESLTSSVRSTSCRPKSPVFLRSPSPPKNLPPPERSATCESPVENDGGQTEHSHGHCTSPVFGRTGRRQKSRLDVQKRSVSPSAAELRSPGRDGNSAATEGPSQSLRQADHNQDVRLKESSKSDDADDELKEISKERDSDETELTSNMTLVWSDEDDDVTPVGSPSPVFPEEKRAIDQPAPLNHVTAASPGTKCRPSSSSTSTGQQQQLSTTESTVHYYWGVPFCPRGLDPDSYTQVILAQMEVYEKSLKQAQRCLLRKAEWGEPILPQPEKSPPSSESPAESPQQHFPQRHGIRLRSKKLCDTADTSPAEAEEEEDNKGEEDEEEKGSKEEEKNEGGGDRQVDSDDCEVCPETQLSVNDDDRTQDLTMDTDAGAESDCKRSSLTSLQPKSPERPEVEMIIGDDSPAGVELQEEEMEVDAPVDRKMKGNTPVSNSNVGGQRARKEEVEEDPDVEEIKDPGLQRSTSPELELAIVPQVAETSVDCPICQGSFPVTQIEMHAAYCDGDVAVTERRRAKADCYQVSRRKRTRRGEATAEEAHEPSNTVTNQEKCFICQKVVPLRDYSRHTELCIQRQTSKTAEKENLLSALEKTESRDSEAGPSGSKLQPGDVIDLRDDDEEDEEEEEEDSISAIRISNSPIRAFIPISEATGCLIDFKKQHRSKKLSQRRR